MRVLVIDDDPNIIQLWKDTLKEHEIEVLHSSNGREGIDLAKSQKPDFILLDEIMPDMQGNDVLKLLKHDPETKMIPVAIVSNYSYPELKQEAINLGALDYIQKYDIDPIDLVGKINNLIKEAQNSK